MFGIDFARPKESFKLKMAWDMLHKMNFGVFGQMIIIPLLQKHRILTQVAGYHTEVIKFLPPMTITKEDMDWFLTAMDDVRRRSRHRSRARSQGSGGCLLPNPTEQLGRQALLFEDPQKLSQPIGGALRDWRNWLRSGAPSPAWRFPCSAKTRSSALSPAQPPDRTPKPPTSSHL
jgi:hypothetical protein